MIRKLLTVLAIMAVTVSINMAQWAQSADVFSPDTTYIGGSHGIAVTPDGKIWQSSFFSESWVTPDNDTLSMTPIYVFNPDGTLDTKVYTVTDGTVTDTLDGSCRGLDTDNDGNILYVQSGFNKIIIIDYQTGARIASRLIGDEIGTSPTAACVDDNDNIYIGPVVGNLGADKNIYMYDKTLTTGAAVVNAPPAIGRTMEVSPDGNTIYWMPFTATKTYVYTKASEFDPFVITDSIHIDMSIETSIWHPTTGNLWVSDDGRGALDSTQGPTWYEYDVAADALIDSFSLPLTGQADEFARGLGFSPDGNTAYVGLFGSWSNRVYKFVNGAVGVELISDAVPSKYALSQNYPNPFNPTTTISFAIPEAGSVTLKIFDMLGREVTTLVNEDKTSGVYNASFDASQLASGTYIYTLRVGEFQQSKKMILMK